MQSARNADAEGVRGEVFDACIGYLALTNVEFLDENVLLRRLPVHLVRGVMTLSGVPDPRGLGTGQDRQRILGELQSLVGYMGLSPLTEDLLRRNCLKYCLVQDAVARQAFDRFLEAVYEDGFLPETLQRRSIGIRIFEETVMTGGMDDGVRKFNFYRPSGAQAGSVTFSGSLEDLSGETFILSHCVARLNAVLGMLDDVTLHWKTGRTL